MDSLWPKGVDGALDEAGALLKARRVHEALERYEEIVALGVDPLAVGGERWMAHMLLGDFEAAWRISDRVLARTPPDGFNPLDRPFHQRAVWNGAPLDGGTVLVRCYHGLGDIVQFCRFLPLVARRASRVWVQAPVAVHDLISPMPGVDGLFPLSDDVKPPHWTVQAELMELPFILRATLETLPRAVPYLSVPPERVAGQEAKLPPRNRTRVGLAWAAGGWDGGHRSVPLPFVERLMTSCPDVDWVCLQRGDPAADAIRLPFCDRGTRGTDLVDTAAMILSLDMVVSVDTVLAHIAGALGCPVWTMLHHEADWRWLLERPDSPWYPSMTLYRQPVAGDWSAVMNRIAKDIAAVGRIARR